MSIRSSRRETGEESVIRSFKIGACLLVACVLPGCGGGSSDDSSSASNGVKEIVLGEPEALTGAAAPIGQGMNDGVTMAVKQIAADGGFEVNGQKYKFRLAVDDYASSPDKAVLSTQKLITQEKARFIIGPNLSLAFVPAAAVLKRADVLVMSGSTSIAGFLGKPGYERFFKLSPGEVPRGQGLVKTFAAKFPNVKKVAMLLPGDDAGKLFQGIYAKAFKDEGIDVVYNQTFPTDAADYQSQLTKIKQLSPDALFTGYLDKQVGTIIDQALQLQVTKTFMLSPGPSGAAGFAHQKEPGFGLEWSFSTRSLAETGDPALNQFKVDFKRIMGRAPDRPNDYYTLHTHDAVMLLAAAMQKAGTVTDVDKIAKDIVGLDDYPHSALNMVVNHGHEAVYSQSAGLVKDGKVSYVKVDY
jgi:branched-chain amino acid transport system substrate-binding protein